MKQLLFILLIITPLLADVCQPLYWEIDPTYQASLDETAIVAAHPLILGDVKTSHGLPFKKEFIIFDIKGTGEYDDAKVKTKIVDDSIVVTGGVINLTFQLYLMTKPAYGKGYDGKATASLNNITVNYTKKPALVKGAAIWTLANLSPSIPNNLISNNDTNPPFFNISDRGYFEDLITTDLYSEVSAYYNMNLSNLYAQALQTQAMSKTFNSSALYAYVYPGTNISVNLNVSVANFSISAANGVALGYYGQVQGDQKRCSTFVPDLTSKASYITKEMILSLWEGFQRTNVWQPNSFDGTTLKSKYFKFKMVDLDAISPIITSTFSNLLEPLVGKCNMKPFEPVLEFDKENQRIGATVDWSCRLVRTAGGMETLLKFDATLKHKVAIEQQGNKLVVRITETTPVTYNWIDTAYPVSNKELADIYLKDLISSLTNINTIGDGFLQPKRVSPRVTIEDAYVKIIDEAGVLKEE